MIDDGVRSIGTKSLHWLLVVFDSSGKIVLQVRCSPEATNIPTQLASIAAVYKLVNVSVEAYKLLLECVPMEKVLKTFGTIGRGSLGRVLGLGMTRAVNKRVLSRHGPEV